MFDDEKIVLQIYNGVKHEWKFFLGLLLGLLIRSVI
jgi:hypothetical protein